MKDGLTSLQHKNLDEESVFAEDEKAAALDDNSRYTEYQNLILFFSFFFYRTILSIALPSVKLALLLIFHDYIFW